MSVWTHVSGSVRIDAFTFHEKNGDKKVKKEINKRLGKISTFEKWIDNEKIHCTPMQVALFKYMQKVARPTLPTGILTD